MPMPDLVYYDAPYLDEAEHSTLDHTGIPGVGGGGAPIHSTLTAYLTDDVTSPTTAVVFDTAIAPSDDMEIDGDGNLLILTDGLYQITLNPNVTYDAAAEGFSRINPGDAGGTDFPDDNYFFNGNTSGRLIVVADNAFVSDHVVYPPTWFAVGNTFGFTLSWSLLEAGEVTFNSGTMLYVVRLA